MNKAKFTGGEWSIDDSYVTMLAITANEEVVATVECDTFLSEGLADPTEEQLANAHLIAAAPKMYAEIEAIHKENIHYLTSGGGPFMDSHYEDEIKRIGNLLKQARGEK